MPGTRSPPRIAREPRGSVRPPASLALKTQGALLAERIQGTDDVLAQVVARLRETLGEDFDDLRDVAAAVAELPHQRGGVVHVDGGRRLRVIQKKLTVHFLDPVVACGPWDGFV